MPIKSNGSGSLSTLRIPSLRASRLPTPPAGDLSTLIEFIQSQSDLLVLTGAGLSTRSGVPAYRDSSGQWLRRTPIFYQDFIRSPTARRRYWARSYFGWQHIADAKPNPGHFGLARLQANGSIRHLITQNVDGLHTQAGSQSVTEIHGQLGRVKCLDCHRIFCRHEIQSRLSDLNKDWSAEVLGYNPDGDVDLDEAAYPDFKVVDCTACKGSLKPDVVFFGESVPLPTLDSVQDAIENCSGVLVIGSSLVVMSGYRVVKEVARRQKPVAVINQGLTRADDIINFKIDGDCVKIIHSTADALTRTEFSADPTEHDFLPKFLSLFRCSLLENDSVVKKGG